MCKMADYPELYTKTTELLRIKGISGKTPGYEILRKAIVVFKVKGELPRKKFLKEVIDGMVIPSNREVAGKLENKNREPAIQWMIESVKSEGLLKNTSDPEKDLMNFIQETAQKL